MRSNCIFNYTFFNIIITFIISNFAKEKKIPLNVTEKIERFLSENSQELKFSIID